MKMKMFTILLGAFSNKHNRKIEQKKEEEKKKFKSICFLLCVLP